MDKRRKDTVSELPSEHWQTVWDGKDPSTTSWFQQTPSLSLELITANAPDATSVVDIGSGRSTFVAQVLSSGVTRMEVLDIARQAVDAAAADAGHPAGVTWTVADISAHRFDETFDVWHDRAVFHFLTDVAQRDGYRQALRSGTHIGSTMVVATFAEDGPEYCSGLPVQRYSADSLAAEFPGFEVIDDRHEDHVKPDGTTQHFQYLVLRRTA